MSYITFYKTYRYDDEKKKFQEIKRNKETLLALMISKYKDCVLKVSIFDPYYYSIILVENFSDCQTIYDYGPPDSQHYYISYLEDPKFPSLYIDLKNKLKDK